ncbi:MAG: hypothetical protein A3K83_07835 [Omnitrophica WOR_2 bacterium RBG_13_44_8b]|nr:MAG: hypothetical protein A3K83_07835 [Omnitrophica WOR_2 bacterium RBG_13_44_8b]
MIRNIKKHKRLVVCLLFISTLFSFYILWLSPHYTVPILMYHRFGYESNTLFVTPENFDRQMAYLKNKKYNVISFDQLVSGMKQNKKPRRHTVVITIDDGYKDVYQYAFPILKKYAFPAIIFLISDYVDTKDDFVSWEEVKTMSNGGIAFGAHTRRHLLLTTLTTEEELRDEIGGSKYIIERKLGIPVDYFCYPSGVFDDKVKTMVKNTGYKGACGIHLFCTGNDTTYELKRIKITNSDTTKPFNYLSKLSGYYNVFRSK